MLRTQDFIAPVGGGLTVQIKANYIKYLDGSAGGLSTRIRVRSDRGGADLTMEPGDSVKLPQDVAQFTVENADGEATIAGVLIAGLGEFNSDRVIGTVSVIDVARDRTMAGVSFLSLVYMAANAASNSMVQLWNPAGSGRRAIVQAIKAGSDGASGFGVYMTAVALANLYVVNNPINKLAGGAVSVLQHRTEYIVGSPAEPQMVGGTVIANDETMWYRFAAPVILPPGYGLKLWKSSMNQSLTATFDFYEEPA